MKLLTLGLTMLALFSFVAPATAQGALGKQTDSSLFYIGPGLGITKYNNLSSSEAIPSLGLDFGAIFSSGVGVGGFVRFIDSVSKNNYGAASTDFEDDAMSFGTELAYHIANKTASFRVGFRAGLLSVSSKATISRSGSTTETIEKNTDEFFVGPVLGFHVAVAQFLSLGASVAWETTLTREVNQVTRLDPRFEVRFNF